MLSIIIYRCPHRQVSDMMHVLSMVIYTIHMSRVQAADARAEYGEMNITKLNQRIDAIEVFIN